MPMAAVMMPQRKHPKETICVRSTLFPTTPLIGELSACMYTGHKLACCETASCCRINCCPQQSDMLTGFAKRYSKGFRVRQYSMRKR